MVLVTGEPRDLGRWKVLVVQYDKKIMFQGHKHLVDDPDDAKWFNSIEVALEQVRDTAYLNTAGIVQFRIMNETYK